MNLLMPQHQDEARKMTDAPEKIWAYTQDKTRCGIWRSDDDRAVAVEYTRSDVADALRTGMDAAQHRAYWLAIAICGGEDAPGYVDSVPLVALTDMLRKERQWRDTEADTLRAEVARLGYALFTIAAENPKTQHDDNRNDIIACCAVETARAALQAHGEPDAAQGA